MFISKKLIIHYLENVYPNSKEKNIQAVRKRISKCKEKNIQTARKRISKLRGKEYPSCQE